MKQQKTTNKVIALLLAVLLVLGTAPAALAADGEADGDKTWASSIKGSLLLRAGYIRIPIPLIPRPICFPS